MNQKAATDTENHIVTTNMYMYMYVYMYIYTTLKPVTQFRA